MVGLFVQSLETSVNFNKNIVISTETPDLYLIFSRADFSAVLEMTISRTYNRLKTSQIMSRLAKLICS